MTDTHRGRMMGGHYVVAWRISTNGQQMHGGRPQGTRGWSPVYQEVVPTVLGVVPRVQGVAPRVLGVVPRVLGGRPQGHVVTGSRALDPNVGAGIRGVSQLLSHTSSTERRGGRTPMQGHTSGVRDWTLPSAVMWPVRKVWSSMVNKCKGTKQCTGRTSSDCGRTGCK